MLILILKIGMGLWIILSISMLLRALLGKSIFLFGKWYGKRDKGYKQTVISYVLLLVFALNILFE